MTTLYELVADFRADASKLADLDADEQTVLDTLESLRYPVEQKCLNVAAVCRNLEAVAESIRAAEAEMAARRKALQNRSERLRAYLKMGMESSGISKVESPYFNLAIRQNPPAVVIDAESQIPEAFMRTPPPPPPVPDKKAIADAIKAGQEVSGAHLERGTRLEIK